MADKSMAVVTGNPHMHRLANALSDSLTAAMAELEPDEALSVAIAVVADYGRGIYGNAYLAQLAEVIVQRSAFPMPETIKVGRA